jgi:hypothetical protein
MSEMRLPAGRSACTIRSYAYSITAVDGFAVRVRLLLEILWQMRLRRCNASRILLRLQNRCQVSVFFTHGVYRAPCVKWRFNPA